MPFLDERKVIIFDEPTAVLANDEVVALLDIVRSLLDHGVAVLYISHRLDEVQALADRITVLRDGRMMGPGAGRPRPAGNGGTDGRARAGHALIRISGLPRPLLRSCQSTNLAVDHGSQTVSFSVSPAK